MRKWISFVLACSVCLTLAVPAFASESTQTYPVIHENGMDYVPVRAIAEELGFEVSWNQDNAEATLTNEDYTLQIKPFDKTMGGSFIEGCIDAPVIDKDWRIYMEKDYFNRYANTNVTVKDSVATINVDFITPYITSARSSIRSNNYNVKESFQVEQFEVMVPMDDGVKLQTIVYKPVGDGPWPTAFSRGPYPIQGPLDCALGEEYASRGMAYVFQYCRGKGGSEGDYVANVDERRDGIASLNWLSDQTWVESIGMFGHSYLGLTTWIVGDSLPEKVKALHISAYGVLRNLSVSHSGLVAVDNITAWTLENCTDKYTYEYYLESAQYLPQIHVDTDLWGKAVEGYADWVNHPDFTDPYWNEGVWGDLKNAVGKINVPTTIFGGYYDHHFEGTISGWELLNDDTKAKSHMVLGCWNHNGDYAAKWKAEQNYNYDRTADVFNWFYGILVDGKVPSTGVDAYIVGQDEWVHMDEFPLKNDGEVTYYLTGDETESDGKAMRLSLEKPSEQVDFQYLYDPSNPKIAEGGECFLNSNSKPDLRGSNSLSPAGYRDDVMSFISDPVEKDVTLAGNLIANLFVASDAEDTAFTYTISEVDAEGTAHNIRNGLLTLAYRHDRYASPVNDYTPGEVVEMKIESLPIVWTVSAGNRIRIDISSSDFPEFSSHTNTVGNWAEQTEFKVANQTIYAGGKYASSVVLPVLSD